MKIDEKALDIAVDVYCKVADEDGDIRNAVHEILTAYEAARWRPIEEYQDLPSNTEIEVFAPKLTTRNRTRWYDFASEGGKAFWADNAKFPQYEGTMFRTIDPPPKP